LRHREENSSPFDLKEELHLFGSSYLASHRLA
jgi:hypothetical protein